MKLDHEKLGEKCKELENFKDNHDAIFQGERNESMQKIISLNAEKEEIETRLTKELDST